MAFGVVQFFRELVVPAAGTCIGSAICLSTHLGIVCNSSVSSSDEETRSRTEPELTQSIRSSSSLEIDLMAGSPSDWAARRKSFFLIQGISSFEYLCRNFERGLTYFQVFHCLLGATEQDR